MQDLQDSLSGAYHGVVYHGYQIQHLVGVNSCAHVSYYMGQFLHEAIDFEQGEEVDLSGFSSSELFEKLRDFVVSGIGRDPVIQELHEKYVQRLYEDGGKTGASSVADSMSTMQEELTEQEQLDLVIQLILRGSATLEQQSCTMLPSSTD